MFQNDSLKDQGQINNSRWRSFKRYFLLRYVYIFGFTYKPQSSLYDSPMMVSNIECLPKRIYRRITRRFNVFLYFHRHIKSKKKYICFLLGHRFSKSMAVSKELYSKADKNFPDMYTVRMDTLCKRCAYIKSDFHFV